MRRISTSREAALVLTIGFLAAAAGPVNGQPASQRQQETTREAWQRVPEIFGAMAVAPGAVVADVGAGDGFLTARLARAVGPTGRVFAVDVDDRATVRLRARVAEEGLTNVTVVNGDANDPRLGAASLDAAVIVNAYHEMVNHQAMLQGLRAALKPGGRLVIVEPTSDKRSRDTRDQQTKVHEIAAAFVEQEARDAGFAIRTLQDPFVSRANYAESLVVAVPYATLATDSASTSSTADERAQASPDLRIAFDLFKKRRADGSIVVVDVRSEEEFLSGHIPGALWIELADLSSHLEQLRSFRKPIVTYCS
jgi:ubiquinone/menaquinone biosynthesis C-methylase UbiE